MLYEKGIINKFYLNKYIDAYNAFSMITARYPENALAYMAKGQVQNLPKDALSQKTLKLLSNEADGINCSNYPNPFNPTTRFSFSIPKDSFTELKIYNSLGQEVKTLVSEHLSKGRYSFEWNAMGYASGIYYYTLRCGDMVSANKLILLK